MISYRNTLRFLCLNAVIFLCHSVCCESYAAPASSVPSSTNIFDNPQNVNSETVQEHLRLIQIETDPNGAVSKVKLCGVGQYVAQCGNYRVGFNWLKKAEVPDPENSNGTQIQYKQTNDYYIDEDILGLFTRMRIFFGDENAIMYNSNNVPFDQDEIKADREAILNNLCHPSDSYAKPVCLPCPNNAKVDASTVDLSADNLTVSGTWVFHTIADCYMNEFEDSTGTYFYVPDNLPAGVTFDSAMFPDNAESCYYTNTNSNAWDTLAGDEIGTFVPRINANSIDERNAVRVPISGVINR